MEEEALDLGPGELIKDNNFIKHQCYRITTGEVIAKKGCLLYRNQAKTTSVTTIGEVFEGTHCCKLLRLNQTHVVKANTDDTISINEFSFPSLMEEENILAYPPKVADSIQYINELALNSSIINAARHDPAKEISSTQVPYTPPLIDAILGFSFFKWSGLLSIICMYITIVVIIYYGIKLLLTWRKSKKADQPLANDSDTEPSERNTRSTFEVKF